VAALIIVTVLALTHLAPWLAVVALTMLLARAVWGLSRWRRPMRAQTVGIYEVLLGFATIALYAAGYWFGM
jgi:hypothetical protein